MKHKLFITFILFVMTSKLAASSLTASSLSIKEEKTDHQEEQEYNLNEDRIRSITHTLLEDANALKSSELNLLKQPFAHGSLPTRIISEILYLLELKLSTEKKPKELQTLEFIYDYWLQLSETENISSTDFKLLETRRYFMRSIYPKIGPRIYLVILEEPGATRHPELREQNIISNEARWQKCPGSLEFLFINENSHAAHVSSTIIGKKIGMLKATNVIVVRNLEDLESILEASSFNKESDLLLINSSGRGAVADISADIESELNALTSFFLW